MSWCVCLGVFRIPTWFSCVCSPNQILDFGVTLFLRVQYCGDSHESKVAAMILGGSSCSWFSVVIRFRFFTQNTSFVCAHFVRARQSQSTMFVVQKSSRSSDLARESCPTDPSDQSQSHHWFPKKSRFFMKIPFLPCWATGNAKLPCKMQANSKFEDRCRLPANEKIYLPFRRFCTER